MLLYTKAQRCYIAQPIDRRGTYIENALLEIYIVFQFNQKSRFFTVASAGYLALIDKENQQFRD